MIIICTVDVHGNEESYEKIRKCANYDGSYAGCITAEYGSLGSRGMRFLLWAAGCGAGRWQLYDQCRSGRRKRQGFYYNPAEMNVVSKKANSNDHLEQL